MQAIPRFQKLLKKPAIQQGAVVLVDQGVLTLATFITGVLVARGNSKEDYGIYVLGWSLLLIFQGIHRALVNLPFTVYAPRLHHSELKTYQGSTLIHTAFLCIVSALTLLTVYLWGNQDIATSTSLHRTLPWLVAVVIPLLLREYVRNSLLALLKVWATVGVNIVATLVLLTLVTGLFISEHLSVNFTYQIIALVYALAAAVMIWNARKQYQFKWKLILPDFLRGWPIARWTLVDVLAYMGASQVYPWLLLLLMDQQAVAAYGACLAMASLLTPFLRGSIAYIFPRMAHGYTGNDPTNLMRLLRLSVLMLSAPFILWLVIGTVFNEQIVTLAYGDAYSNFGFLFVLLLIRVAITSISSPYTNALQTLERADVNTASLVVGALVTIALGIFLISYFGLTGAGLAGVVSTSATAIWRWVFLKNILRNYKTLRSH